MNVLFGSGVQDARYRQGLYELREDLHIGESGPALRLTAKEGARIGFERDETGITVYYDRPAAFFRQLRRALSAGGNAASFEERVFDTLSLLVDNSRNAVMNVPAVKELIRKLALLGYSELQLYTEDMRGRNSGRSMRTQNCSASSSCPAFRRWRICAACTAGAPIIRVRSIATTYCSSAASACAN